MKRENWGVGFKKNAQGQMEESFYFSVVSHTPYQVGLENYTAGTLTMVFYPRQGKFEIKGLNLGKEASSLFESAKALTEKHVEQTEFAQAFWVDGAKWDFDQNLPGGPSVFELFSALATDPGFGKFIKKKQVP